MNKFKIISLSKEVAARIRDTRKDDFGNNVVGQVATGYALCRLSLKSFKPGVDKHLLFSYSPFEKKGLFNERGPLFIFEDEVEPYSDIYRFPPEIKAGKVNFLLSLIGYNKEQQMVFTRLASDADVDELIVEIFDEYPGNRIYARP